MKIIVPVAVCAVLVLLTSQSFAAKIHLKDGKVVDAKIIERGSYYVVTMTGKKMTKYFLSQIDYIEEDEVEVADGNAYVDLSKFEGIAEDKVKLIFNFIDVSGVRSTMTKNIQLTIDQAPKDQREKYKKLFNVNEIIELLIPIYNRYYSKVDLINMIQFYDSPTGVKVLESTPDIMKETVDASIRYIKEKSTP